MQTVQHIYSYFTKKPLVLLVLLMIISFAMKLMYLGAESLWLDEASTLRWALMPFAEILETSLEDPNGPIYQLLLKVWISAFGISEFSIRFMPAIFGTLLMWPVYLVGRNLFDKNVGFLAAILCMFSNNLLFWSHENRGYTLVVLLAVWSFYHFFKILSKGKAANLAWYTLITTLLVFTHLTATMVVVAQFAASMFYLRSQLKRVFMIYAGMFVATTLIVVWVLQNSWIGGGETVWSPIPNIKTMVGLFNTYLNESNVMYFVLICVAIFLSRTFLFKVKYKHWQKLSALLLWGLLPIILTYLVSVYYNPRFLPKYMLYTVPGLYLGVSTIIMGISGNKWMRVLLAAILVFMMAKSVNLNPDKPEKWRKAVAFHNTFKTPNTVTAICAYYQSITFAYYYDVEIFKDYRNRDKVLDGRKIYRSCSYQAINNIINKHPDTDRLILILSHEKMFDKDDSILNYFNTNFRHIKFRSDLKGIRVFVFDLTKPPQGKAPEMSIDHLDIKALQYETIIKRNLYSFSETRPTDELVLNMEIEGEISTETPLKNLSIVASTKGFDGKNFYHRIKLPDINPGEPYIFKREFSLVGKFTPETDFIIYVWQPNDRNRFEMKNIKFVVD